jgi:hypothetical protein
MTGLLHAFAATYAQTQVHAQFTQSANTAFRCSLDLAFGNRVANTNVHQELSKLSSKAYF